MTSPQFLIVKIQAILGGRAEDSEMQRRSVAIEYYKLCRQSESQLEHCVALIKAGRDYPALQVAESSNLLDSLNVLMFPELNQWRDFCDAEKLPSPPPFDDSQIELVSSIYARGVSQNHPLYRDYRRAMRLRKYEDALPIIKTISKINAYDAEVRKEYNRLRVKVATKKLGSLERAVFKKDDVEISKIYKELESEKDLILDNPIWIEASAILKEKELEHERKRCSEIINELARIDLDIDFSYASDLVTEFNMIRTKSEFSKQDIEFIEKIASEIADKQDKIISAEKALRAKNSIKMELENPEPKESISVKIAKLKRLHQEAEELLDEETERRYLATISKLNRKKNSSFICKTLLACSSVAAVTIFAFVIWQNAERTKVLNIADSKLVEIEHLNEKASIATKLAEFEKAYPDLAATNFSSRISTLKESLKLAEINLERFKQTLSETENINFLMASSVDFDNASANVERLYAGISNLSPVEQAMYTQKLDELSKKLRVAIEDRKISNARATRELLEKFEDIAEDYENFARSKIEIDADAEKIAEKLRPYIEDISTTFKAHRLDVDKYNELSVRIADAKNKYATFDKLRDLLFQSRNLTDFLSAVEILEESGATPSMFARKLSRISKDKESIKIGQIMEFGSPSAVENVDDAGLSERVSMPENKMITNLYRYSKGGRFYVYTIGKIEEKVLKWNGGSETIQEVKEIASGGRISTRPYRKYTIAGRAPQGELLSGGIEAPESVLAKATFECAAEKSALAALKLIGNMNVNAVFKARLEAMLFEKLRENPIATLFEYSPLAQARAKKVDRYAAQLSDHSWIFESNSREKLLASELYSTPAPDYYADAQKHLKAIQLAKRNPLELVGVCDEFGKASLFKDATGDIWGVSSIDEKFGKLGKNISQSKDKFAPLSPIFSEKKSVEEIMREAEKVEK